MVFRQSQVLQKLNIKILQLNERLDITFCLEARQLVLEISHLAVTQINVDSSGAARDVQSCLSVRIRNLIFSDVTKVILPSALECL